MAFYLNPAENKPQFAQGEKNIESFFKRMNLLNGSSLVNYTRVLVEKHPWRAIGQSNINIFVQLSLLTKPIFPKLLSE